MGTLSSELAPHADRLASEPRIYADANVPAGIVAFMRQALGWDVLFVLEHDELRRAPDAEHFRLARRLCRTIVSFDRDYLDDRAFPPGETSGVLVLTAPTEDGCFKLLRRLDAALFRPLDPTNGERRVSALPLSGRKLHAHVDWSHEAEAAR